MARKKKGYYTADFETTTDPNDCRVWAFGIMDVDNFEDFRYGNNIHDFFKTIKTLRGEIAFHNLKFDGTFIIDYLLKNGYEYSEKPQDNTFKTVIADTGAWYGITITFKVMKDTNHAITITDSLKKLPFPVSTIAKAFKLPILKGEIDYHTYRGVDHVITVDELKYLKNDVEIMARALNIQRSQGLTKLTIGSDSLSEYKSLLGGNKGFRNIFPVLTHEVDSYIRKAYRGGFTWVNPVFQAKDIGQGLVYDVNSLYPYIMYKNLLPHGVPINFNGKYEPNNGYPLFIQRLSCEFELKEGFIPTIQMKTNRFFKGNDYLDSSKGELCELYMTNEDLDLLFKHYDVTNITYHDGKMFMGIQGAFKKYIDKWSEIKANNKGAIRELAKLMLNNLYGKFATNPVMCEKIPVLENNVVRYVTGEAEVKEPCYTAMGVFITSGARHMTITTAQENFDRILYCDTDSIHLKGLDKPDIQVHDTDLGYWCHESTFEKARFLRQKTYIENVYTKEIAVEGKKIIVETNETDFTGTKLSVKVAGMPENIKRSVTWENFQFGFSISGKKMPRKVSGGTVLLPTTFTIL